MHELSIAMSILRIAREEAAQRGAASVSEIEVDLGRLSGVDPESLSFVFDSCVASFQQESCLLKLNLIEAKSHCNNCNTEFTHSESLYACPHCNSWDLELLSGKELRVKSLLID